MVGDLAGIALRNTEFLTAAKKEAITDPLTGLYNRRHFFDEAAEAVLKASSYEFPLSIFIFDIDNFKNYNDTNGHSEGDVLLKEMGGLLKKHTRSTNTVARYGGEEFIVLIRDCDKDQAMAYAENIRKLIESHPFNHREKQPLGFVSISGGVASYPADGKSIKEIVELADRALYRSKG
ncbi:diguanylate cyclase, partial [Candidatus Saccharibacteria bacterium]|nr:diguanylate cyclase [Candidatus Saccharibacteria bacterium]